MLEREGEASVSLSLSFVESFVYGKDLRKHTRQQLQLRINHEKVSDSSSSPAYWFLSFPSKLLTILYFVTFNPCFCKWRNKKEDNLEIEEDLTEFDMYWESPKTHMPCEFAFKNNSS